MDHGYDQFIREQRRANRRVAIASVAVGLTIQLAILAVQIPFIHRHVRDIPILRFGLEGPPRVVELVRADAAIGESEPLRDIGHVTPSRRGGAGEPVAALTATRSPPGRRTRLMGPGDAPQDLVAKALRGEGRVPIFQSEELVIDRLVRPDYPEHAHAQGIEGHVAVLAHVDTIGNVIEVEVMSPSGTLELDAAAREAVMQCRFRPYRKDGIASEVYAVFRFAFRIY